MLSPQGIVISQRVVGPAQARKNSTLEGRKELENDDSAPAAGTKKLKTGAIPQEPINHAPQLIDSGSTTCSALPPPAHETLDKDTCTACVHAHLEPGLI